MPEPASLSSTLTTVGPDFCTFALSAGAVMAAVGAIASTLTVCDFTASAAPVESHVRNLTVVLVVSAKGAVYWGELAVGSEPSSVKRVAPSPPEPLLVADSETWTGPLTKPAGQAAPSQAIVVSGSPSFRLKVTCGVVTLLPRL